MRRIFMLLMLLSSLTIHSQILKERRVYYLDCSYSMKEPNGIWDEVKRNLKNAIEKVTDETTELVVIPFAFDKNHHASLPAFSSLATTKGKEKLKDKNSSLSLNKSSMTYHSDPLMDFYKNRVNSSRVTYMFFMTDGQNEEKTNHFQRLLRQWGNRYASKNVYGFYVMLNKAAYNHEIDQIIDSQSHLWKVKTADVNINTIRLQSHAVFNARNDKYFELPIWGDVKGMHFAVNFPANSPYYVRHSKIVNGKLRVYVSFAENVHSLPYFNVYPLAIKLKGGGTFDFLLTESIPVKCESKPERSLKVSVK